LAVSCSEAALQQVEPVERGAECVGRHGLSKVVCSIFEQEPGEVRIHCTVNGKLLSPRTVLSNRSSAGDLAAGVIGFAVDERVR
jgi:hypothetical protein